jgi:ribonuclease P protein component
VLPAGNRLRRRQDFATAVRRGRKAGRPLLVAHLCRGPAGQVQNPEPAGSGDGYPHAVENSVETARAGFVVSRAVGNATVRNRVKRRLRHVLRDRMAQLPPGSLLVVRALPPAASASSADLAADLDAALRRLLRPAREGSAR